MNSKEVISKEQATKEVNEWLDSMDIRKENREKETVQPAIDTLIEAMVNGELLIDGCVITQKLKTPLGDGATSEIIYDFRFSIGDYNKATKDTSLSNEIDYAIARLSLVSKSKLPKSVFEKLERHDYHIASRLAVFF